MSPLRRTVQTAKALSKYTNCSKMILENKLVEQNFGDWSGKKISKVWEILKNNKKKHNFSFISPEVSPPNGESFEEQRKKQEEADVMSERGEAAKCIVLLLTMDSGVFNHYKEKDDDHLAELLSVWLEDIDSTSAASDV